MRSISFGGSAHLAFLGVSGSSTLSGFRSCGTDIIKASQRPSGDQARAPGDSVKLLIGALMPLAVQYMNSCAEPSGARAMYAIRVPSGDHLGEPLVGAPDRGRSFLPSMPTSQTVPRARSVLTSYPMRT